MLGFSMDLCSQSLLLSFPISVVSPIFKEIFYMEKRQFQSINQCRGVCLENFIDWSIAFSKDDVSSDEEDFVESISRWIVGGKRKRLVDKQPDDQPVRDLIINYQPENPA